MLPTLPPVHYVFFDTGLEMKATKEHVKETADRYGVEIETVRPKVGIVNACRKYGLPFISKAFSERLGRIQRKNVPLDIADEFAAATDKRAKFAELLGRFPKCVNVIEFLGNYKSKTGTDCTGSQFTISSKPFLLEFLKQNPLPFIVSSKCCDSCKKKPAHMVSKRYEMVITGERKAEGGQRTALTGGGSGCFAEKKDGTFRLRPLYWVSDKDKEWYKETWGIRYSDAYEVYGLKRTGCCGCPISSRAVEELEMIRQYEPNLVKAAWAVFGDSYRFRAAYNAFKAEQYRKAKELPGQMSIDDLERGRDGGPTFDT